MAIIASAALLYGQPNLARSAIFEELDNGTVVSMDDGVSADTPSSRKHGQTHDDSERFRHKSVQSEAAPKVNSESVLVDIGREETPKRGHSATAAARSSFAGQRPQMPSPRLLTGPRSLEQIEMRRLAVAVARSYARTSAVKRASLKQDEFVELFTLMIHRESNFNPLAVSRAGAKGLGQLMPATARDLGVCDVFSAQQNLDGAARYLTKMLDRFGSAELALAAYNAGPDAVLKYGGIPPYKETQQYVSDIFHAAGRAPRFTSLDPDRPTTVSESATTVTPGAFSIAAIFGFASPTMPAPQRCTSEAKAANAILN